MYETREKSFFESFEARRVEDNKGLNGIKTKLYSEDISMHQ